MNNYRRFAINIARKCRDERGAVLAVVAVSLLGLIGFVGLALDTGVAYDHRRDMQTAADAGALAGASEIFRHNTSRVEGAARDGTATNYFDGSVEGVTVTVNFPPAEGYFVGDDRFVEVIVRQPTPTFFMRTFGIDAVDVTARAVAGVGANGEHCIYVLDPTASAAFHIQQDAVLTADCGLVVNSNDSQALDASGQAEVSVTDVAITGDYSQTGRATISPEPRTSVPPSPDPLAHLPPPDVSGCDYTDFKVENAEMTLSPGVYCGGITLAGHFANAFLEPGIYVIKGGGLTMENVSEIEGDGVMFYITDGYGSYGPVAMEATTEARLKAPTTGTYAGILMYADPDAGNPNVVHRIESHGSSWFEGALYFPNHELRLEAVSTSEASYGFVIARELTLEQDSQFLINSDFSPLAGASPIKRISLVE